MADAELVKEDEVDVNPKIKQNVLIWKADAPIHRLYSTQIWEKFKRVERKWNWKKNDFFRFLKDERTDFEIMFLIMIYVHRIRQIEKKSREFVICYLLVISILRRNHWRFRIFIKWAILNNLFA